MQRTADIAVQPVPTDHPSARCDPLVTGRERLYNRYTSTHSGYGSQAAANLAFQRDVLPHLPADQAALVLDVGCGQGAMVSELVRAGYRNARGVDISPEQVAAAHRAGVLNVQHGDLETALEGMDAELDVLIAVDLLEHLDRDSVLNTLGLISRALRPGGTLLARTPNGVSPFAGNFQFGDLTHETCFTPRSIRQALRVTGFVNIDVRPCEPFVHGAASRARWLLWRILSILYKAALGVETGSPRGHVVTQNMLVVASTPVPVNRPRFDAEPSRQGGGSRSKSAFWTATSHVDQAGEPTRSGYPEDC
ncbi:class I SAM-dependent methyltransferase [Parafrankia sp. FMc2]|uniref:class I SAM-dependent methyltransferase n=1 Tax=Parafrankia sp. FMc2 TaxID=3233196 RepID=UPI0034D710F1